MLSIGISKYDSKEIPSLVYPGRDAQAFADLMKLHGAESSVLLDAARSDILSGLDGYRSIGDGTGTFIMYFAGHGWNSKGIQRLAAADSGLPGSQSAVVIPPAQLGQRGIIYLDNGLALSDIMQHVNRLPFRYKLVVIDACANNLDTER